MRKTRCRSATIKIAAQVFKGKVAEDDPLAALNRSDAKQIKQEGGRQELKASPPRHCSVVAIERSLGLEDRVIVNGLTRARPPRR